MREINVKEVNRDSFTNMSFEAQLLFFYYCINAEEDGFLRNPQSIRRGLEIPSMFFDELKEKGFIEVNEESITITDFEEDDR